MIDGKDIALLEPEMIWLNSDGLGESTTLDIQRAIRRETTVLAYSNPNGTSESRDAAKFSCRKVYGMLVGISLDRDPACAFPM